MTMTAIPGIHGSRKSRKRDRTVSVVARATAQGGPWTVWAVPESAGIRALHALHVLTARSREPQAQAIANKHNAQEART